MSRSGGHPANTMAHDSVFTPRYTASWGLVIGINEYAQAARLHSACSDAEAVAAHLTERLAFPGPNVRLLRDGEATRQAIMAQFMALADRAAPDDRVLVFFAGHGFTRTSRRGEVGFLVPQDGDPDDLSTLIRWDELTRNAEIIPAKHLLFIMDACYGGLALTRTIPTGSQRFLKDMLARYARQVLTAGKADEVVADANGPRPGHSIFTGHLLDALEGAARTSEGIITANAVMTYVYDRVAKDQFSRQTPHYGFVDGDGDFVFEAPQLDELLKDPLRDQDVMIAAPAIPRPALAGDARQAFAIEIKEYLAEPRYRIRLDDALSAELRSYHQVLAGEEFATSTATIAPSDVAERLRRYERVVDRLVCIGVIMARWGGPEHRASLATAASRLVETNDVAGGQVLWLGLRWHSADYFLCAAGVAAVSTGAYENLAAMLLSNVALSRTGADSPTLLEATIEGVFEAAGANAYKTLPGHERQFTPRSEYLFKVAQPIVEDLLYLGRTYEGNFDKYEALIALAYVDLRSHRNPGGFTGGWGPPGRFAWKAKQGIGNDPFSTLVAEAARAKEHWPPLRAGLFGGSYERFEAAVAAFRGFLRQLPFY